METEQRHAVKEEDHSKNGADLHLSATSSSSEQRVVNLPGSVFRTVSINASYATKRSTISTV